MTGFNIGMAIELVVAVLLVLTIGYCTILNRRLTRLRADEEILRATIAELITATEIAERAIFGLKATAADCEKSLGGRLAAADGMVHELDRQIAAGSDLFRRITSIVGAAFPGQPVAATATAASVAVAAGPVATAPATAAPAAAPREPVTRALQAAAQEASERLSAYRKGARGAAA